MVSPVPLYSKTRYWIQSTQVREARVMSKKKNSETLLMEAIVSPNLYSSLKMSPKLVPGDVSQEANLHTISEPAFQKCGCIIFKSL